MCFWSKKCCMWWLSKGGHQELFLLPHKTVQSKYVVYKNVLVSYMYLIIDRIISIKVRCGDLIKAWSLTTAGLCGRSIQKLNTVVKTNHFYILRKTMIRKNCLPVFFKVVCWILKVISHISMQISISLKVKTVDKLKKLQQLTNSFVPEPNLNCFLND